MLDNVENVQASWVTQGPGVAQASLYMGCNDFGSVMLEENVVCAAGRTWSMTIDEVEHNIRGGRLRARPPQHALRPPRGAQWQRPPSL